MKGRMQDYRVKYAASKLDPYPIRAASPQLAAEVFHHDGKAIAGAVVLVWSEGAWAGGGAPWEYDVTEQGIE